ncbi:MAG: PfkB family carbohydrate kinase, partial [Candidatus Limnocylindrales bacterium]
GARIAAALDGAGIAAAMSSVAGESRRTVSVVSAATGGSTLFNEPGPHVQGMEWQGVLATYARFVPRARVIVMSGSLPPGVPQDAYAELGRVAHGSGVTVIVDADGRVLERSLAAAPDVVKPNSAELRAATGVEGVEPAMRALLDAGARAVVATFGVDGIRAVTPDGAWSARLEAAVTGVNPTGAGDAVAAALAAGLEDERELPAILADAVAWSAAAVAAPLAGELDPGVLASAPASVRVEPA